MIMVGFFSLLKQPSRSKTLGEELIRTEETHLLATMADGKTAPSWGEGKKDCKNCDPGRHLQECSGARAGKCPAECFSSAFEHLPRSAPKSAFRVLFVAFLGLKSAKKHSKNTLWGTPRQVPKNTQKAFRGALSGPGP